MLNVLDVISDHIAYSDDTILMDGETAQNLMLSTMPISKPKLLLINVFNINCHISQHTIKIKTQNCPDITIPDNTTHVISKLSSNHWRIIYEKFKKSHIPNIDIYLDIQKYYTSLRSILNYKNRRIKLLVVIPIAHMDEPMQCFLNYLLTNWKCKNSNEDMEFFFESNINISEIRKWIEENPVTLGTL